MMPERVAITLLRSLSHDYCHQLRKLGHKQAAELVQANADAALRVLSAGESNTPVPHEDTDQ